jgi:uncharacterized membrane protein YfcA
METISQLVAEVNPLIAVALTVGYAIIDGLNTYYTKAVARGRPVAAATSGALVYVLLAFGILQFTDNPLYLVPLVIGSWIGTYVVVRVHGDPARVYNRVYEQES